MPISYDEAHALLDAVLNFKSDRYDLMLQATTGHVVQSFEIVFFDMKDKIELVESAYIPDELSVWDAIKKIAKYKEENNNDAV